MAGLNKAVDLDNVKLAIKENNEYLKNYIKNSSGGSADAVILEAVQTAHGFSEGEAVYLKHDGTFGKALAKDSIEIEVIGVVSKVTDADNFTITTYGYMKTTAASLSSFGAGVVLYLSEDTAGALVDTTKTFTKPVGIKTSDGLQVLIQRADMKTGSGSSGGIIVSYTEQEITNAIDSLWA